MMWGRGFMNNWWMPGGYFPFGITFLPWIFLFAALDIVLKGISLYRAARNGQKGWFIALLIVNSLGILPVIYLLLNREKPAKSKK